MERDLGPLLKACRDLLKPNPLFFLFSCHTPLYTPLVMEHLIRQTIQMRGQGLGIEQKGCIEAAELKLTGAKTVFCVPSGTYGRWFSK